jgi:hypothetical protein
VLTIKNKEFIMNHNGVYKRTSLALKYLYTNSLEMQGTSASVRLRNIDPLAHAKEYCTIKMTTSRQSGHSYAITNLLNDLDGEWMILSPNLSMSKKLLNSCKENIKRRAIKYVKSQCIYEDMCLYFESSSKNNVDLLKGYELDGVIVDGASFLKKKDITSIYNTFIPHMIDKKYSFFIFVQ